MKIMIIKMAIGTVYGLLKQLAPMTSNKVDDKLLAEVDRIMKQINLVLK